MKSFFIKTGIVVFLVLNCQIFFAQNKLLRVRIFTSSLSGPIANIIAELEIDHYQVEANAIITEITESAAKQLKKGNYNFQVLTEDVGKELELQNELYYKNHKQEQAELNKVAFEKSCSTVPVIINTPVAFQVKSTFGGYYSYAEMVAAIDSLQAANSGIVQKIAVGTSAEGRTIWGVKISDNVLSDEINEPEVLYMALQHAREAIGGSSMIFFMQYLCENYSVNNSVKDLVDTREFFIIPCSNPDGWEYNRTISPNGGGGWRKNRRLISGATYGVDLNRNWGVDWGNCAAPILGSAASCGSNTPSSDTYYGTAAFSEPETQALKNFIISHNFIAAIDQHAYGPYYSLPFGRSSLHNFSNTPGITILDSVFYSKTAAIMGKYNGMRAGNSFQSVGYEVAGGFKDWMLLGDIGVGGKIKSFGLTGEGGAGGGTGGTYGSFWAPASQIIPLCKGMVYQNLQLALIAGDYYDIQDVSDIAVNAISGSFEFRVRKVGLGNGNATISMIPLSNISTVGAPQVISSGNYNDVVNGTITYTLPPSIVAGQTIKYAWKVETVGQTYYDTVVKVYNPVQLFYDNMEAASVTTNWTVSGGWNYTTTSAYEGSKSFAESPTGNYTANSTRTATYKNTLNLTDATATYVSFWVRHRAENFRDLLQLQVSTNGTTWIPICGKTTVKETGTLDGSALNGNASLTGIQQDWVREFFDLSAYNGQSALRIRLFFKSGADGSGFAFGVDDGFYIDNFKIIKTTFVNTASRIEQKITMDEIGQPLVIFPNPVTSDFFTVYLGEHMSKVNSVQLTDIQGRLIQTVKVNPSVPSGSTLKIATVKLAKGVYLVNLLDKNNSIIEAKRIIKL